MAYLCSSGPVWLLPASFVALRVGAALGIREAYVTAFTVPCLLALGRDGMGWSQGTGLGPVRDVQCGDIAVSTQPASLRHQLLSLSREHTILLLVDQRNHSRVKRRASYLPPGSKLNIMN